MSNKKRRLRRFAAFTLIIVMLGCSAIPTLRRNQNTRRLAQEVKKGQQADASKVRRLLADGGDPNALLDASGISLDSMLMHLLTGEHSGHGSTIFIHAAGECNEHVVRSLLEAGANVRDDAFGYTPLAYAVSSSNHRNVALLVEYGADVNCSDQPVSPLLSAIDNSANIEDLSFLIAHRADVNQQLHDSVPISWAVSRDNIEGLRTLLRAGADVNRADWSGRTALMNAAMYNKTKAIPVLLEAGADRSLRDQHGETAEQIALSFRHKPIAELIRTYHPPPIRH
jgi:ankyrin repeat protein